MTAESILPPCPECQSPHSYEMGELLNCGECGHEWAQEEAKIITDALKFLLLFDRKV